MNAGPAGPVPPCMDATQTTQDRANQNAWNTLRNARDYHAFWCRSKAVTMLRGLQDVHRVDVYLRRTAPLNLTTAVRAFEEALCQSDGADFAAREKDCLARYARVMEAYA